MEKLSTEQFIEKARSVHGDKYDYSLVNYSAWDKEVLIICPKHGEFNQRSNTHLNGSGCQSCAKESRTKKKVIPFSEFERRANHLHNNTYTYIESSYVRVIDKLTIVCPLHGEFRQTGNKHLCGRGCPKCGRATIGKANRSNLEKFLEKANALHNEVYDYSLVNYTVNTAPVEIICKQHGVFKMIPRNHLIGQGCPHCAKHGFKKNEEAILYLLKFQKPYATFWKVGITNRRVKDRFVGEHQAIVAQKIWRFDSGNKAQAVEKKVLSTFSSYKFPDSFLFELLGKGGDTECFLPTLPHKKVISFIDKLVKEKLQQS